MSMICSFVDVLELHHFLLHHVLDEVLQEALWRQIALATCDTVCDIFWLGCTKCYRSLLLAKPWYNWSQAYATSKVPFVYCTALWVKIHISLYSLTSSPETYLTPYPNCTILISQQMLCETQCICLGPTPGWLRVLSIEQSSRIQSTACTLWDPPNLKLKQSLCAFPDLSP